MAFLETRSQRWVDDKLISPQARDSILSFERRRAARLLAKVLFFLQCALFAVCISAVYWLGYESVASRMGDILDIVTTSTIAAALFILYLRKIPKRKVKTASALLALACFFAGAVTLVLNLGWQGLDPYLSLLIWVALAGLCALISKQKPGSAAFTYVLITGALTAIWKLSGENSTFEKYAITAVLVLLPIPALLTMIICFGFLADFWRWLSGLRLVKRILWFFSRVYYWYKRIKLLLQRSFDTGGAGLRAIRRVLIALIYAALIANWVREHFQWLRGWLCGEHTLYAYCTLAAGVVLLTHLPWERPAFSIFFTLIGSVELFCYMAHFRNGGIELSFDPSIYTSGRIAEAAILAICLAWAGKKITEGKKKPSELFGLGPLGLITAICLLALL